VHLRHRGLDCLDRGRACIAPFAAAVGLLVRAANASRAARGEAPGCAVLFASDRRLSASLFRPVALGLGCAFLRSERERQTDVRNGADNGEDTGVTAMRDVHLLAQASDLVGSFGSTLTLTAQELLASQYVPGERVSSVVLCHTSATSCLPPLPLITVDNTDWWHLSLERWPDAVLRLHAPGQPTPAATTVESSGLCY